ncbi:hypothetical protein P175DRAFT_0504977 [Aspergillus ochraceoroseus IBT 24754]|uniref:Peroxin 11C n=3 Tax=Aspergillus subgen. Nidulantes TaxID=2720870 RepID=A0A0F8VCV0_9EURO|nr:uncharacterized protein P175DRAFT_0504977 [Aspergillus ochraceoroseus IBT 24754]KKK18151.1 hypothetical protein AOCH_004208 [Aspergillus ochraceoroseus]KKK20901.1 hypothetical protein ARAM_006444 [Aspergillus rambellii]PTU17220.1 hypothetical protein P175DRAFT_0504977 [Aspergillus ochraceoroseus IBT 24754]
MDDSERPPDPTHPVNMPNEASRTEKPASPAGNVPVTSGENAQRRLLTALRAVDVIIARLDKAMSTASGQERVFAFVGYTSHVLHHILASAPWIALQTRLGLLARLRSRSTKPTTTTEAAPQTSPLLALSSLISEIRYSLRLLGLFPLWTWGSGTIKSPPSDRIIYALTLLQVISNMIYQASENVGFLSAKGVISKRWIDRRGGIDKWYLWSTRAWLGHIVLQYFVLWRARALRRKAEAEGASKEKQDALKAEYRGWKKSLVNNVCWTPLCLHWSVEKGIGVPGQLTGFVSFLAGAWGFYDLWTSTA